jgi:hypothetical protein
MGIQHAWEYNILVVNPDGKRPLIRRGREGNIKIDLREMELEGTDWIHLAQYAIGVSDGLLCFM